MAAEGGGGGGGADASAAGRGRHERGGEEGVPGGIEDLVRGGLGEGADGTDEVEDVVGDEAEAVAAGGADVHEQVADGGEELLAQLPEGPVVPRGPYTQVGRIVVRVLRLRLLLFDGL